MAHQFCKLQYKTLYFYSAWDDKKEIPTPGLVMETPDADPWDMQENTSIDLAGCKMELADTKLYIQESEKNGGKLHEFRGGPAHSWTHTLPLS